jgi:hypothetical protein
VETLRPQKFNEYKMQPIEADKKSLSLAAGLVAPLAHRQIGITLLMPMQKPEIAYLAHCREREMPKKVSDLT